MIQLLLSLAYLMLTGGILAAFWRYRAGSPLFWHPVAMALMATGTFVQADMHAPSDVTYSLLFFVAIVAYTGGALLYLGSHRVSDDLDAYAIRPVTDSFSEQKAIVAIVFAVSALISLLYYRAIGHNVFLALFQGDIGDSYSDLRLSTYAGEGAGYFAPGYVNQFKNVLLPLSATAIAVWLYVGGRVQTAYVFMAVALPSVVVALAGTGQRAYIVFTVVALIFSFAVLRIGMPRRLGVVHYTLLVAPALAVLSFMTSSYAELGDQGSGATIQTLAKRLTFDQQEGAFVGFRYIYIMPTSWFYEWWEQLRGLAPNLEGSTLAHEVYQIMYGTLRGTAPLSPVGSAYYNGGVLGVVGLYAMLGYLYAWIYHRFLRGAKTVLRSLVYGFAFFYLAVYVVDAPISLIENGVVTLFLLLALLRLPIQRSAPAGALPARRDRLAGDTIAPVMRQDGPAFR